MSMIDRKKVTQTYRVVCLRFHDRVNIIHTSILIDVIMSKIQVSV